MGDGKAGIDVLSIVLDINPVWWGDPACSNDGNLSLHKCLEDVIVFANSHLMLSCKNKLAVFAAHSNSSYFLYPPLDTDKGHESNEVTSGHGIYDTFAGLSDVIKERIQQIITSELEGELNSQCIVAGSIAMALCYIERLRRESEFADVSSRILVIKRSEDNPGQYMNLMNVIFSAQKQNITIDACILDNHSGLLQQACDITGGIYLKISHLTGLLQYLLWVFLPSVSTRGKLSLPPRVQVDYRAACFCHRKLIDIGYVCSVCLSIFCTFSPICSTCQSTFRLLTPTKVSKKRSKGKT